MLRLFVKTMRISGTRMKSSQKEAKSSSNTTLKIRPPIPVFGVPGRYVSALFSAAAQLNELEETEKQLNQLNKLLNKPKIYDFMASSMLSRAAKTKVLKSIASEAGMTKSATNFLGVVAENGRLKMLRKMITLFHAVMVAHRKEALCEVITAEPLNDSTRSALMEALKKYAKGKQITLTEKIDKSIIGGMIVGVEDKHMDMSIAKKIQMYTDILRQSI